MKKFYKIRLNFIQKNHHIRKFDLLKILKNTKVSIQSFYIDKYLFQNNELIEENKKIYI